MNRLDDVLGPANWWDEYMPQENSVICRLTIRLPDGTTLTKSDAGGYAGMSDSGDDDKSGFSDAFKRAAVKFGIGRYLYRDGVPRFVQERIQHPSLSADPSHHALPSAITRPKRRRLGAGPRPAATATAAPQTGKALFAWIKQQDEKHGYGLLKLISDWAKQRDFPARMVQWNAEQVQQAFIEARRRSRRPKPPRLIRPHCPPRPEMDGRGPRVGTASYRPRAWVPILFPRRGRHRFPSGNGNLLNLGPAGTGR